MIAQANSPLDELGQFPIERVSARVYDKFLIETVDRVSYMDVSPKQVVGVSAALIPFLEHDDANRALMGSNMQRQAVPLLRPRRRWWARAWSIQAALDSGQVMMAEHRGRGGQRDAATGSSFRAQTGVRDAMTCASTTARTSRPASTSARS